MYESTLKPLFKIVKNSNGRLKSFKESFIIEKTPRSKYCLLYRDIFFIEIEEISNFAQKMTRNILLYVIIYGDCKRQNNYIHQCIAKYFLSKLNEKNIKTGKIVNNM